MIKRSISEEIRKLLEINKILLNKLEVDFDWLSYDERIKIRSEMMENHNKIDDLLKGDE